MEYVVCLYGNGPQGCGAGWLATTPKGMIGTGEPVAEQTFTEAVWHALESIQMQMNTVEGEALIFEAGGERMARVPLGFIGYYSDLKWEPATVYTIDLAPILEAASKLESIPVEIKS